MKIRTLSLALVTLTSLGFGSIGLANAHGYEDLDHN